MSDDVVIRLDHLWKSYGLAPALRDRWRRWRSTQDERGVWALRDLSFEVKRGETLGIIGRNGAGKSTLLKVLARVTPPTRGKVDVRGQVFPMIEVNAGLHMELTGRENVHLLGAIMGFSRSEIRRLLPLIEEFCELGEWFEQPVRKYSSGMLARLGFSVAMNIRADILLIDEVLSVGDLAFQRRCFDRIEALRRSNSTILFVSHNVRQVERLCSRAILMYRGQIIQDGATTQVTNAYYASALMAQSEQLKDQGKGQWVGSGEVLVEGINVGGQGGDNGSVVSGETLDVDVVLDVRESVPSARPSLSIQTSDFVYVACLKTQVVPLPQGRCTVGWHVPALQLLPGVYTLSFVLKEANNRLIFRQEHLSKLTVLPGKLGLDVDGLIHLPATWRLHSDCCASAEPVTGSWGME